MDYKVLYRKYRPKNFDELVGQNHVKSILKNSIVENKIAHAYIFTGPRGTGKTSTAKIFAKTINCTNVCDGIPCEKCETCINSYNTDIIEMDAASNNHVENIREIIENVEIAPMYGKYKIFIIDEVHMLSASAWNAFLKTLEEPPSNVIFILATTEIQKVPITILSRCQRFDFKRLSDDDIIAYMKKICDLEKISCDEESFRLISKLSDGCMRDALSILDQLSKIAPEITVDLITKNYGTVSEDDLEKLYSFILKNETENLISYLEDIKNRGIAISNFLNLFESFLLNKAITIKTNNISNNAFLQLKKIVGSLNELQVKLNSNSNGFLLLEIELLSFINDDSNQISSREINQIISREIISTNKINSINNIKNDQYYQINDDFIKIRINNSFANANKNDKIEFISKWSKFTSELKNSCEYKKYINKITPQVISSTNALFVTSSESLKIICNSKIHEIEKLYKNNSGDDIKFIVITNEDWKNVLLDFNQKKKDNYKYIYQSDEKYINNESEDNMAEEIFGQDKIIIE